MKAWLVIYSLFWSHNYGHYSVAECEALKPRVERMFVWADCVPLPAKDSEDRHAH